MREAFICGAVRTPVGKYGGVLRPVSATTLAATVISNIVDRYNLPGDEIEDVILGHCTPGGETPAIGRIAALQAGLPVEVPGVQIDRRCASGLQAVCQAAMQIQTGASELLLAGGVESMSTAEFYSHDIRWGPNRGTVGLLDRLNRARITAGCDEKFPLPGGMIETAENVRERYKISREDQDAYALESHRRAIKAWNAGTMDGHVVPVSVPQRKADDLVVSRDEGPREDTSLESLARLRPVFPASDGHPTVTAGNACAESDAAAVAVVASPEAVARHGLEPIAVLRSWAVAGVHPGYMGIGPVPATRKALAQAEITLNDIDLIELNEAFAVQVLACTQEWKFSEADFERLNVNGGAIAIGHPLGATGARILADLLAEMQRRKARYALETMCVGGGQGIAAVFELVSP